MPYDGSTVVTARCNVFNEDRTVQKRRNLYHRNPHLSNRSDVCKTCVALCVLFTYAPLVPPETVSGRVVLLVRLCVRPIHHVFIASTVRLISSGNLRPKTKPCPQLSDYLEKHKPQTARQARGSDYKHRAVTPKVGEDQLNLQEYRAMQLSDVRGCSTPAQVFSLPDDPPYSRDVQHVRGGRAKGGLGFRLLSGVRTMQCSGCCSAALQSLLCAKRAMVGDTEEWAPKQISKSALYTVGPNLTQSWIEKLMD